MLEFNPPPFKPHWLVRGGHLQTIFAVRRRQAINREAREHRLPLPDGDTLVLHENCPPSWQPGDQTALLIHGLSGCYLSAYMIRLSNFFYEAGVRVFRLDSRGSGAGGALASQLNHAGRSEDVVAAIGLISQLTVAGEIMACGISLGGNQLLRAAGRIGGGLETRPEWFDRVAKIAAVCPPVDLAACSQNMQRWILRPYNAYFIRGLLNRAPEQVKKRSDFQQAMSEGLPRTLWELDDRFTGPLSGFRDAADYYGNASSALVTANIQVPTLVLAARNDPMVPVACFADNPSIWSKTTHVHITQGGGHVGFYAKGGQYWADGTLAQWFDSASTN